ncbi:MAG: hypothetical protein LBK50_00955 [Candidatus Nomurabacteria bacterium]|jgi:hypothetical protein|nr:hypothetical protein [Candidatus Nomurabacteria bacterium]
MTKRRALSLDAETNGLYGQAFSIAAIVREQSGRKVAEFIGRCPIEEDVDGWVAENVLPQMEGITETHESYEALLGAFIAFYKEQVLAQGEWGLTPSTDVDVIVHCGVPVEARLFIDAVEMGMLGPFEGPLPLKDVGTLPEIGSSVDIYLRENGIELDPAEFNGGTHNPLYDSEAAFAAYAHWMKVHGYWVAE